TSSITLVPYHYILYTPRPPPTPTLFPYTTLFRSRTAFRSRSTTPPAVSSTSTSAPRRTYSPTLRAGPWSATCRSRASITPLGPRSEEHTSELQSLAYLVCRLLLEKKKH